MLRLETQRRVQVRDLSAFAFDGAIQKIAGVELNSRLVGEDFHHAARGGFLHARGQRQSAADSVQDPVVIVAVAQLELRIRAG